MVSLVLLHPAESYQKFKNMLVHVSKDSTVQKRSRKSIHAETAEIISWRSRTDRQTDRQTAIQFYIVD